MLGVVRGEDKGVCLGVVARINNVNDINDIVCHARKEDC